MNYLTTFLALALSLAASPAMNFWNNYDARKAPLNTEIIQEWEDDQGRYQLLRYDLGKLTGSNRSASPKIAAYLGLPKNAQKVPGIVHIHGGGQRAHKGRVADWVKLGYAAISINWGGRVLEKPETPNTNWDGLAAGFLNKDKGLAHHNAVCGDPHTLYKEPHLLNSSWNLIAMAARRALTVLEQHPQVDADKLGVEGHSMGGRSTVLTAIDPRIKAASPSVGGSGYLYEDLWGLPGSARRMSAEDGLELYQQVVSAQAYWPHITAPLLFLGSTNDFNSPTEFVVRGMSQLPVETERVLVLAPHLNHRFTTPTDAARFMWMEAHLKGNFQFPKSPAATLSLTNVPLFRVTPDQPSGLELQKVEIYYGYARDPRIRFWRSASTATNDGKNYFAHVHVFDTNEPLFAFANITYKMPRTLPARPGNHASDLLTISSEYKAIYPDQLSKVKATEKPQSLIDDFSRGWQDWYRLNPDNPHHWFYATRKIIDPSWMGPKGAKLDVQVVTTAPSNTVSIGIETNTWQSYTGRKRDSFFAQVALPEAGANAISLSAADFKNAAGQPMADWDEATELSFSAHQKKWQGKPPTLRELRWNGGSGAPRLYPHQSRDASSKTVAFDDEFQKAIDDSVALEEQDEDLAESAAVRIYKSDTISHKTSRSVDIDVDVSGVRKLFLVMGDAADGIHGDHGSWVAPTIDGKPLTDLKRLRAATGWGKLAPNKTAAGKDIVPFGIGAHATSMIGYALPPGSKHFKARGVVDSGGTIDFQLYKGEPTLGQLNTGKVVTYLPADRFTVPDDLEVTVWATTPLFHNPTNFDIDHAGRVWVAEGVNYRLFQDVPQIDLKHPKGDRVVVVEDSDQDGKADTSWTFVQDKDLVAPLGVAVIDNKIVVSAPPDLLVYTDVNRNLRFDAGDTKERFLSGFGGKDHDHSLHSVTVGPDGEWYFNTGNAGTHIVTDKSGFTVRAGSPYRGGSPSMGGSHALRGGRTGLVSDDGHIYIGGLAFRIRPDGTGMQVIGHNFRNSYEETVDSFGNVFHNDNDDPPASRTTWLMEYGNLGFVSEDGTRTWQADQRPGQSIPDAEWRQHDPGTIPAGDVYGSGGPTGIVLYENGPMADKYRGLLLSCESGARVIYGYYPKPKGAGFELERFDFFKPIPHEDETYFRPTDVAVGPDGAIYVSDWFDKKIGSHLMRDPGANGTIYRIAPKGKTLRTPQLDLSTTAGQIAALRSPAHNVRYLGFAKLRNAGAASIPAVSALLADPEPYMQARGIWLLSKLGPKGIALVENQLTHNDPEIRITAFRALRRIDHKHLEHAAKLAKDPAPRVRREVALAMRNLSLGQSRDILLEIARGFDGQDRWYLEASSTAN